MGIVVSRSVQEVWRYVADPRNLPRWLSGVSDVRLTSEGTLRPGSTFASTYTYGGRTHEVTYEVTEVRPPNRLVIRSVSGPYPFESTFEMEEVGEVGTQVFHTLAAGADSKATGVIFLVLGPFLRAGMRMRMRRELLRLSELIEALPLR